MIALIVERGGRDRMSNLGVKLVPFGAVWSVDEFEEDPMLLLSAFRGMGGVIGDHPGEPQVAKEQTGVGWFKYGCGDSLVEGVSNSQTLDEDAEGLSRSKVYGGGELGTQSRA